MDDAPLVVVEEAPPSPPSDPVTVIVDASPTIISPPTDPGPDPLALVLDKLSGIESRLDGLERGTSATRAQDASPVEEVGPPPEPSASETVIAPTEEIAPAPAADETKPTKRHAGFWV